jgi:hypothetical protein
MKHLLLWAGATLVILALTWSFVAGSLDWLTADTDGFKIGRGCFVVVWLFVVIQYEMFMYLMGQDPQNKSKQ